MNKEDWEVKFMHCFREGNQVANWLTNKGIEQTSYYIIINNQSLELGSLITNDIVGVALPRDIIST